MQPTEAQLRWQAMTSLAYGSKGLFYFTFHSPPPDPVHGSGQY